LFGTVVRRLERLGCCVVVRDAGVSDVLLAVEPSVVAPVIRELVSEQVGIVPHDDVLRSFFLWVVDYPSLLDSSTRDAVLSYAARGLYSYKDDASMARVLVARLAILGVDARDLEGLTALRRRHTQIPEYMRDIQEVYGTTTERLLLLKTVSEHLLIGSRFEVGPWTYAWPAFENLLCTTDSPITVPDALRVLEISQPHNDRRIIGKSITRILRERDVPTYWKNRGKKLLTLLREERERMRAH